ncbi:ankyrin repeat-containing domain protein [Rhodocollybia butyracea]|uniref:Ankyrin repeat-containing domain protein n=1 Tax=Rhodocollybia butyracea TaxID=206335 RepID=A0A9P5PB86_9AGAR|nr:ankyrin repeat-containing domain protein [Rhodocollybia butyracea]
MATRSGEVHPALHGLYTKCTEGLMEPTTAELSATLEVVSKDLSPVYLVLDAMDECSEAFDVLKHLAHLKKNLCIAVTSRYLATDYDPELLTEIVDQLSEGAQGQFRWVDCQVTVLERCKTPKSMREALKKLPNTLEETYTLAIERMSKGEHVKDAGQLLMWLVYAFEPLSIAQVTEILAVDLEDQTFDPDMRSLELVNGTYDILDSTLITVNVGKVVQLAHNSVKEFLTQTHAEMHTSKVFKINEHLAHATICQTCVIYLLQFNKEGILPEEEETFEELYPLGIYAAEHWPSHMQRLDDEVPSDHKTAKDLIISLLKDSSQLTYVNWIRIRAPHDGMWEESYDPTLDQSEIQSQLYYMARLNVLSIFEHVLLEKLADVNSQGGQYGNALQAACLRGNKEMVQLLLEHEADINAQRGQYGNALQAASRTGNKDIVQLLLHHKADVNAQGGEYGNALQAASRTGNKDIVQLLLHHKADINAQGGEYGNALQAACSSGNKDIVQLLLEYKADVNAQGGAFGNALQAASFGGHKDIVQLLLEHKAGVNAQGGEYGNALQAASFGGHKDIVQLLLEHKTDINAQGGKYGNALQAAADIVQLLLEHKADVNAQGGKYGNALQAASWIGNKDIDIVQLLLEHKADVNAQGGQYGNALQAACLSGNKYIVQLLLEHKADINAQGGYYGNALQAAAISWRQNNLDIVQLLLEHKADVNAQGGEYENALQAASIQGNEAIVQLLLEHKAM